MEKGIGAPHTLRPGTDAPSIHEHPAFRRPGGELRTRMEIELGQDMFDMDAGGALGNAQCPRDLTIG